MLRGPGAVGATGTGALGPNRPGFEFWVILGEPLHLHEPQLSHLLKETWNPRFAEAMPQDGINLFIHLFKNTYLVPTVYSTNYRASGAQCKIKCSAPLFKIKNFKLAPALNQAWELLSVGPCVMDGLGRTPVRPTLTVCQALLQSQDTANETEDGLCLHGADSP